MDEHSVPGAENLSIAVPLTMTRLIERIFRLLKSNLGFVFGIGTVPMGGWFGIVLVMVALLFPSLHPLRKPPFQTPEPQMMVLLVSAGALLYVVFFMVYALFEAAATYGALQIDAGNRVTFREAYTVAVGKMGRYFWLQILRTILVVAPVIFLMVAGIGIAATMHRWNAAPNPTAAFFGVPALILLYIGAMGWMVLALIRVALAFPASICEGLTAWESIRRSLVLTRDAKGRIFVVALLVFLLNYAGILILELVLFLGGVIGAVAGSAAHLGRGWGIAGAVLVGAIFLGAILLLSAVTWSALCIAFSIIYRDQQLRTEGTESLSK